MGKITLPLKIWRIPIICKFESHVMLRLSVGDNLSERDLTTSWKILERKSPRNQNILSDCKSTMTWTEVRLRPCNSKVVEFLDSKEWLKVWMKVHKMIGKVWIFPEKMTLSKFNYFTSSAILTPWVGTITWWLIQNVCSFACQACSELLSETSHAAFMAHFFIDIFLMWSS